MPEELGIAPRPDPIAAADLTGAFAESRAAGICPLSTESPAEVALVIPAAQSPVAAVELMGADTGMGAACRGGVCAAGAEARTADTCAAGAEVPAGAGAFGAGAAEGMVVGRWVDGCAGGAGSAEVALVSPDAQSPVAAVELMGANAGMGTACRGDVCRGAACATDTDAPPTGAGTSVGTFAPSGTGAASSGDVTGLGPWRGCRDGRGTRLLRVVDAGESCTRPVLVARVVGPFFTDRTGRVAAAIWAATCWSAMSAYSRNGCVYDGRWRPDFGRSGRSKRMILDSLDR